MYSIFIEKCRNKSIESSIYGEYSCGTEEEMNEMKDGVIPSLEDKEEENFKDLKISSYNINQNDYDKKVSNISKIEFKDLNEMCDEYISLYNKLTD